MTAEGGTNDFDRWLTALQEAIREREEALYSARVLAEARQPHNMAVMGYADAYGLVFGPCGDTMEFFLLLDGRQLKKATFMTDGCGPTVACGSMLSRMVEGMSLDQALAIEPEALILALDGLPAEHVHCATLAVNTLREALANCTPEEEDG
jgi:nitrogen fixation NifU-like protein